MATLVAEIVHPPYQPAATEPEMEAAAGSTIPSIAAGRRIATGQPRTGSAERLVATLWQIVKRAPVEKWAGKGVILPVIGQEERALATGPEVETVRAIERAAEVRIELAVGTCRAAAEATGTPSAGAQGAPRDTTDQARAPVVAVAHRAWAREAGAGLVEAVAAGGNHLSGKPGALTMKLTPEPKNLRMPLSVLVAASLLIAPMFTIGQQAGTKESTPSPVSSAAIAAKLFETSQQAADALVKAAASFDVDALEDIFGPEGDDIVLSGEYAQDQERALNFAAEAREKQQIVVDPKRGSRAFLLVGTEEWPFPVPLVKTGQKWYFDAKAGRQELLNRRIGSNELDAIDICEGYVDAQHEYATQVRQGYDVNQYAQRIISTPGKQDGLAWQNADGSWQGPIGEKIARAIAQGYSSSAEPYHGYFFKILKGQGPSAPLGELDYVVNGVMIGGFALLAAPAEYGETGVKTFMVSNDGVVYEKDFGPSTLSEFARIERFDPGKTWSPVPDDDL